MRALGQPMLYRAYQAQVDMLAPAKAFAGLVVDALDRLPTRWREDPVVRWISANNTMLARTGLTHSRPSFDIHEVCVDGDPVAVREEVVQRTACGSLLHFAKDTGAAQPRVLVVSALAGHFSTLLASTVRALSAQHDVYLTDWHDARNVPLSDGFFGFDDYVDHIERFLARIGPGAHVVAVCQPCPAVLAAVARMAAADDPATPRSLTLMAGPVDTRVSPTAVNRLAQERTLSWFEQNVITTVPWRYAGAGRRVYPGFLQLGGFVAMNWRGHLDRHLELFHDLTVGNKSKADATAAFYDEYCAVLDLHAEFYLETVDRVFQRHLLPRGLLEVSGELVDLAAIRKTGLLTVEGGRDDICGMGQTMAAQDLVPNIARSRRRHHLQAGVGHYGVFSGSAWERQICPVVHNFILDNE
jgi:poly(3-hydroxybutyrate) depolymerase